MGKKVQVRIGELVFPTKGAAKKHVQEIVASYADGKRLGPEHHSFALELLGLHPEHAQKIGVGIHHFTIQTDAVWGTTRHFQIHRTDGSETDFSWQSCIDVKDPRREVLGAMRGAVREQIMEFKERALMISPPPVCPFNGIELTAGNSHVDHESPATFAWIADQWFATMGGFEAVKISAATDQQWAAEMTCDEQKRQWQDHHQRLAKLRLVSAGANLSEARTGAN